MNMNPAKWLLNRTRSPQGSCSDPLTELAPAHLYTLLGWRLTALGINPKRIERHSPDLLLLLRSKCAPCADKGKCLEGMMDCYRPPGWESYCPNAEAITALAANPRFCGRMKFPIDDHSQSV